ncbi:MAG: hypothetical protein WCG23_06775 [bacterium]
MQNKKNIFIFATTLFLCLGIFLLALRIYKQNQEFKIDEEKIQQRGYSYVYSNSTNKWREYKANNILASDDIMVSKVEEGKCYIFYFSSYQLKYLNQNLLLENVSTFIKNGKLYTFDYSSLKMSEIIAAGSKFNNKRLDVNEIQKIYPYVEVIKVSDFKNGYLKIKKNKSSQSYLLLSDANYYAYNYNIGGCGFELKREDYLPMFTITSNKAKIVYSFFGNCNRCDDEHPCLTMEFFD